MYFNINGADKKKFPGEGGRGGVQAIPSHAAGEGGRRPTIGKLTKGI